MFCVCFASAESKCISYKRVKSLLTLAVGKAEQQIIEKVYKYKVLSKSKWLFYCLRANRLFKLSNK